MTEITATVNPTPAPDTRPRCEYPVDERVHPSGFGTEPVPCSQVVGVHVWLDIRGERHAACWRHVVARMRRYPPAEPDEIAHERHVRDGADPDCRRCESAFEAWSGAVS